jgi:ankyrin repeat protein
MRRHSASVLAFPVCFLVIAALAGCASIEPGRRIDSERLLNAIVADHVEYVQAVIRQGAVSPDQHIPAPAYMEGTPLITIAARSASLKVLGYLLAAGANVNARTPAGETALMLASFFRDADDGRNPRSYERHATAVRMLVQAGAILENDPGYYTPLSYAAYQGHDLIVRFLLERGARVNGDAGDGAAHVNTPLMMASIMGHWDTVLLLLRAGADARIRVSGGHTALELAARYNHTNLVRVLSCAESLAPGESSSQKCQ